MDAMVLLLASLCALTLACGAGSCSPAEYCSPNKGVCVPAKKVGEYCNFVQTCANSMACSGNVCIAASLAAIGARSKELLLHDLADNLSRLLDPHSAAHSVETVDWTSVQLLLDPSF